MDLDGLWRVWCEGKKLWVHTEVLMVHHQLLHRLFLFCFVSQLKLVCTCKRTQTLCFSIFPIQLASLEPACVLTAQ